MKKYINADSIRIKAEQITEIRQYCVDNQYDPYNLFVYYKNGIHVGFSDNEDEHIKIDEKHWMPVHST